MTYRTTQQDAYNGIEDKQNWTFVDVSAEAGLSQKQEDAFVHLMRERFNADKEGKAFHLSYACEWAARIKHGVAYQYADKESTAVLQDAGYEEVQN